MRCSLLGYQKLSTNIKFSGSCNKDILYGVHVIQSLLQTLLVLL